MTIKEQIEDIEAALNDEVLPVAIEVREKLGLNVPENVQVNAGFCKGSTSNSAVVTPKTRTIFLNILPTAFGRVSDLIYEGRATGIDASQLSDHGHAIETIANTPFKEGVCCLDTIFEILEGRDIREIRDRFAINDSEFETYTFQWVANRKTRRELTESVLEAYRKNLVFSLESVAHELQHIGFTVADQRYMFAINSIAQQFYQVRENETGTEYLSRVEKRAGDEVRLLLENLPRDELRAWIVGKLTAKDCVGDTLPEIILTSTDLAHRYIQNNYNSLLIDINFNNVVLDSMSYTTLNATQGEAYVGFNLQPQKPYNFLNAEPGAFSKLSNVIMAQKLEMANTTQRDATEFRALLASRL